MSDLFGGSARFAAGGAGRSEPAACRPVAPANPRRGDRPGPSARPGRHADPHARNRAGSARWSCGDRPAPARPPWRGFWPTRPATGSSRSRRCFPASPISRRCSSAPATRCRAGKKTLLFVDEIHRFNRAQQDSFLPVMEDGTLVLVGATTENPSFELNAALLSRAQVLRFTSLDRGGARSALPAGRNPDRHAAAARRGGAARR